MGKQLKSVCDLDRIGSLPDHILCHILSFLPTENAVRTSILSLRWRFLFASMTSLDFAHCLPFSNVNNFKSFVDRLLFLPNQVSLECFRMCDISCNRQDDDNDDGDHLRLYGWIGAVLRRRVKEIDIYSECSTLLPTLLFTSESLLTLTLNIHGEMKVPSKVCLPNLKILELRNMKFSDAGSIRRLISGCLLLEELYMQLGQFPKKITSLFIHNPSLKVLALDLGEGMLNLDNHLMVINAPNLLYFKYVDRIAESYCFRAMNSLLRADIRVYQYADEGMYDANRECGATYLLQTISNVKSLRLTIDQAETVIPMRPEPVVTFHKLVKLEFVIEYNDWQGTWLIEFLHCVPNLNTLLLTLEPAKKGIKPLPEKVPPCLLLHLKEIKLSEFDGDEHVFEMISYFLQHAILLEKLIISMKSVMTAEEQLEITKKLLMIPRNSEKCQVATL